MLAVIKSGGKQYLVWPGKKIKVEKIDKAEGKEVLFRDILLLIDDQEKAEIGQPRLKQTRVRGKIIKQAKAKKVIVFKYKAKKRYKKKKGHRQPYSQIEILKIEKV